MISILVDQREADGNPTSGPILRGPTGRPTNLNNLARRTIRPILKAAKIPWHGWYALRRGISTKLDEITKRPTASSLLLGHASATTTIQHYIKPDDKEMLEALAIVEEMCSQWTAGRLQ